LLQVSFSVRNPTKRAIRLNLMSFRPYSQCCDGHVALFQFGQGAFGFGDQFRRPIANGQETLNNLFRAFLLSIVMEGERLPKKHVLGTGPTEACRPIEALDRFGVPLQREQTFALESPAYWHIRIGSQHRFGPAQSLAKVASLKTINRTGWIQVVGRRLW